MSVPTVIFIDTSIVRGQAYNFESKAIKLFLSAAGERKLTLLLPDATSREIRKQISARSDAAINALKKAYEQAPFLLKSDIRLEISSAFVAQSLLSAGPFARLARRHARSSGPARCAE